MSMLTLQESLTLTDYETVEELASQNYGPSDIAKALGKNTRDFNRLWRIKASELRLRYDKGRLNIQIVKSEKLIKLVKKKNVTAIQMHNKQAKKQRFEDLKNDVFGLDS